MVTCVIGARGSTDMTAHPLAREICRSRPGPA
jgi:hypothetical protein